MAEQMPRPLGASELFAAMVAAGVFREGEKFSRVTIELDAVTGLVTIHAETAATARLLDTVPLMTRALISKDPPRGRKMRRMP